MGKVKRERNMRSVVVVRLGRLVVVIVCEKEEFEGEEKLKGT